jgi:N-acetylglucosaminyl-diphospho-decaprenol L-rhamnosyltransferase
MTRSAELHAVFVNYNTWRECAAAVRSLVASPPHRADGSPMPFATVVVDNASPLRDEAGETDLRAALHAGGGELRRSDRNVGYAGGIAMGVAGAAAEWLLVCNADIVFGEGAVDRMLEAMRADAAVAAVMPEGFWDSARTVRLPANHAPGPFDAVHELAARLFPWCAARHARRRARTALHLADGDRVPVRMLSGHCLLLRRSALSGPPFDLAYPLYYEDADLARRLRRARHRLVQANGAVVVHLHDRSARTNPTAKQHGIEVGRARYLRAWHGALGAVLDRCARWLADRAFVRRRAAAQAERLPPLSGPGGRPVVEFARATPRFVALLGPDPWCSLPGIVLGSGAAWTPSDEVLAAIGDREAYVRVFDAASPSLPMIASGRFRGTGA